MNNSNLNMENCFYVNTDVRDLEKPIPRLLDSGCNIIAVHPEDSHTILPTHRPLKASTASGAIMESTDEARLEFNHDLRNEPKGMFDGHVLPTLTKHTIVGLGVLCDHGCVVVLTAGKAYVIHNNKL